MRKNNGSVFFQSLTLWPFWISFVEFSELLLCFFASFGYFLRLKPQKRNSKGLPKLFFGTRGLITKKITSLVFLFLIFPVLLGAVDSPAKSVCVEKFNPDSREFSFKIRAASSCGPNEKAFDLKTDSQRNLFFYPKAAESLPETLPPWPDN